MKSPMMVTHSLLRPWGGGDLREGVSLQDILGEAAKLPSQWLAASLHILKDATHRLLPVAFHANCGVSHIQQSDPAKPCPHGAEPREHRPTRRMVTSSLNLTHMLLERTCVVQSCLFLTTVGRNPCVMCVIDDGEICTRELKESVVIFSSLHYKERS